ncbi:MAG: hypothetical protein RLZZ510_1463, partial [Bacteroidota bacterium]
LKVMKNSVNKGNEVIFTIKRNRFIC